jgi:hypothetical protein
MKKMLTCRYEVKPPDFGMRGPNLWHENEPLSNRYYSNSKAFMLGSREGRDCILFYRGVVGVKDNLFTAFVVAVWCGLELFLKPILHTLFTWRIVGVEVNLHVAFFCCCSVVLFRTFSLNQISG